MRSTSMQNRRTKNGIHPVKITIVIVILIFLAGWSIYAIGNHPNQTAKSQATSLAKKYGKLTSTSAFYTYNRDKTY